MKLITPLLLPTIAAALSLAFVPSLAHAGSFKIEMNGSQNADVQVIDDHYTPITVPEDLTFVGKKYFQEDTQINKYSVERYESYQTDDDGEFGRCTLIFFRGDTQVGNVSFKYTFSRDEKTQTRFIVLKGQIKGRDKIISNQPFFQFSHTDSKFIVEGNTEFKIIKDLKETDPKWNQLSFGY